MALIREEEINNIRDNSNIVDIISGYIPLNKSGKDYIGVCPFHDDHNPSMVVSTKLNIFKCFVCGVGGNVFSFVKRFENVNYLEAVKIVAQKSGLDFKYSSNNFVSNKYKNEFDLMNLSLKYYQNNLATKAGINAKNYLINRGITEKIIKDFQIGLSFSDNDLLKFFENKKCNLETGFEVGLLNKSGIDYFDVFNDRIMIPIFDMQGNLAGYTARSYQKNEKSKYINSKETNIYKKSNILFNYYNAKEIARMNKEIILVEGNMDAISLSASGIQNVCALMGVVLSKYQTEALKRLNARVVLILDSDNAGSLATLKVGESLFESDIDVYVVRLSGAKDPDEYIRKNGTDALLENIKHAKKYLDFKIDNLKENKNLDNIEDLTNYIKEVIGTLKNASDLEKEVTISKICKEYNLDINVVKKSLAFTNKKEVIEKKVIPPKKISQYKRCVYKMIGALFINKDYYKIYMNELGYLINKVERDTVSLIGSYIKKNNNIDISGFIDYTISHEEVSDFLTQVMMQGIDENIDEKEFYNIVASLSKSIDEEEISELREKIKQENDVAKKIELIEKLTELKKGCGKDEGN